MRQCAVWLILSMALCSCASRPAPAPVRVVTVPVADCARPVRPVFAALYRESFNTVRNGKAIAARFEQQAGYILGLEDALECYDAQRGAQ